MKFLSFLCLSTFILLFSASQAVEKTSLPYPYIETKVGYFFFSSSTMRQVYSDGGVDVQVCAAYPLMRRLRVYGSVEYLKKSGHSLNGGQRTSIWEIPLSLGLQPVFQVHSHPIFYYISFGPRYIFSQVRNDSDYISSKMKTRGWGGFMNTGIQFKLRPHFILDIFGEYSYVRLRYSTSVEESHGHPVQVGGLTFGGSLGYAF